MLPHHRTRQTTPQPPRPPQSLHSYENEGDPEPQRTLQNPQRRSQAQEALPHRGRREGLPQIGPQPLHQAGGRREAEEDNRREGRHAPQEERCSGGRCGPRRQLHQGLEHTPSPGQQERILRPGRPGGAARPGLRPGLQVPHLIRP